VTGIVVGATAPTPPGPLSSYADAATTAFASCTLSGTGSSASCSVTYTPTTAGAHAITASYGGDATHEGSSGVTAAAVTVTKHPTKIGSAPATEPVDSPTGCRATVTDIVVGATATTPTGTVSFFADAATTAFASCTLSGTGSSASCSVTYTPTTAGAHAITASYGGDATHEGSSGVTAAAVTVTKHPT